FLIFLQHFRKVDANSDDPMSAYESSAVAGSLWKCLSDKQKEPYIHVARKFNQFYNSRARKIEYILDRARTLACGTEINEAVQICRRVNRWNEHAMDKIFAKGDPLE
ncbi:hypothetical protein KR215_008224, partial [Drosophila sulfurigaster]